MLQIQKQRDFLLIHAHFLLIKQSKMADGPKTKLFGKRRFLYKSDNMRIKILMKFVTFILCNYFLFNFVLSNQYLKVRYQRSS